MNGVASRLPSASVSPFFPFSVFPQRTLKRYSPKESSKIRQTEKCAVEKKRPWFLYAMFIVVAWGLWGAWSDYPATHVKPPFPMTLVMWFGR